MYGSSPWTCGFARRTYIKAPCDNHVSLYASADFLRLLRKSTLGPKPIGIGLGPMLRSDTCLRIYALAIRSTLVRKSPQSPQLSTGRASDGQRPCSIRSCQHSPAMAYSRQISINSPKPSQASGRSRSPQVMPSDSASRTRCTRAAVACMACAACTVLRTSSGLIC